MPIFKGQNNKLFLYDERTKLVRQVDVSPVLEQVPADIVRQIAEWCSGNGVQADLDAFEKVDK